LVNRKPTHQAQLTRITVEQHCEFVEYIKNKMSMLKIDKTAI
jgi:hypothetical protein